MKPKAILLLAFFTLATFSLFSQTTNNLQQPTSVNTDGSAPDASAIFQAQATDKGILIPRMTTAQRTAIASPATGLLVYDTDTNDFWFYNGGWKSLSSTALRDTDGDTRVQTEESADEDQIRFDVSGAEMARMDGKTLHLIAPGNSLFIGNDAGMLDDSTANWNTFVGPFAGDANTSGERNSFFGFDTGGNNTTGSENTFFGTEAGLQNTTGIENTFVGDQAGFLNTTGGHNTALGENAGGSTTTGSGNTSLGAYAAQNGTTANANTAIGSAALFLNTDRSNLVAVGDSSLFNNGTGASNPAHGTYNTAVGSKSLYSNTTGFYNTAIGRNSLLNNTSGSDNTAIGATALINNSTGYWNTATGSGALGANGTGYFNTASGKNALLQNTTGFANTATGASSLADNTTGHSGVAYGLDALQMNTTGSGNTAIGSRALRSNTIKSYLVAVGDSALYHNGIGATGSEATNNTAIGSKALLNNTKGFDNTAVGFHAGFMNSTGSGNTFMGINAGRSNTSAGNNTFIGTNAGANTLTGSNNVFIGYAGINNTTGAQNVMIGINSGFSATSAIDNTYVGYAAGQSNVSGYGNTYIGRGAGLNATGGGNVFLGLFAGSNESGNNRLYIENSNADSTGALIYGEFDNDFVRINGKLIATNGFTDGDMDTKIQLEESADEDIIRLDVAGNERLKITPDSSVFSAAIKQTGGSLWLEGTSGTTPTSGAGTRMMWIPAKGAFRAGIVTGDQWDDTNIGTQSFVAGGANNRASGFRSFIGAGDNHVASDRGTAVFGGTSNNATAIGAFIGGGKFHTASGNHSFIGGGDSNLASGQDAFVAGGTQNRAEALRSFATGNRSLAKSFSEAAFGSFCTNYTPLGVDTFNVDDRLFVIGNGTSTADRSDAIAIWKNGYVGIGTSNPEQRIDARGDNTDDAALMVLGNSDLSHRLVFFPGRQNDPEPFIQWKEGDPLRFSTDAGGFSEKMRIDSDGKVGIGRTAATNLLEVEGDASKSSAGDWLANSDARLKAHIRPLDSEVILQKMLSLQGISYEWNDDKTGTKRPEGIQYGFTAQNIQEVFPTLVSEDNLGYLQTAYGSYDAMTVEAIRALNDKIEKLENQNAGLTSENAELKDRLARLEAAVFQKTDRSEKENERVGEE